MLSSISGVGIVVIVLLAILVIGFFVAVVFFLPSKLWLKAFFGGARISMAKLLSMKHKKIDISQVVDSYIFAKKSKIALSVDEIYAHLLSGGRIDSVISALVCAREAGLKLSVDTAKAIDLTDRDVVELVKSAINPKVVETDFVSCVCRDGIEVKIKARVTYKTILTKVVGSVNIDTILSQIGESIVSVATSAKNHQEVLQNPDFVSKNVFLGCDFGDSCFKILSIDVSKVEIGKNIGMMLKMDSVELEKKLASIDLDRQRAMQQVKTEEMKAKVEEMKIDKLKAEAELPKAITQAISEGKMNILDYFKMQNIIADTKMRESFTNTNSENSDSAIIRQRNTRNTSKFNLDEDDED